MDCSAALRPPLALAVGVLAVAAALPTDGRAERRDAEVPAHIAGPVRFPGCVPPTDLEVCATPVSGGAARCVRPQQGEEELQYTLQVPAGEYLVFARSDSVQPGLRAYYTRAVPCGLSVDCRDHEPMVVRVAAGQTRVDIAPADWSSVQPAGVPAA